MNPFWGFLNENDVGLAAPMVGGMVSATILTLLVVPAIYGLLKGWKLPKET
jgi:Cu(I)/Ag(I) efflux system membrane protein CusA/SilA